jgi:hypothetical protein
MNCGFDHEKALKALTILLRHTRDRVMIESSLRYEGMRRRIVVSNHIITFHRRNEKHVIRLAEPGTFVDGLADVLRNGTRKLVTKAVEAEVADFLGRYSGLVPE